MEFGDWTVIEAKGWKWHCRCVCGTERRVANFDLKNGRSKGCGCGGRARWIAAAAAGNRTHGFGNTPTMSSWTEMKRRCYAKHRKEYANYGGRGIIVCDRWLADFANFLADMGPRPDGHTIERIDNDGNYEPGNCRWTARAKQERNKRSNHMITAFGETMTMAEAAERWSVNYFTLHGRIQTRGWDPERALTTPVA